MHGNLAIVTLLVFLVNLPFGYWRGRVRRFSLLWFLSIHLPVPLVICLRVFGGVGWNSMTYPLLIGAFFAGQLMGSRLTGKRFRVI